MKHQTIVLMRHGAALKNEHKRHGGDGSSLVLRGRDEIKTIAHLIASWGLKFSEITYAPRLQCEESAGILGEELGVPVASDDELRPICLGVIDGLSEAEVEEQLPDLAPRLTAWRNGQLEICDLQIPGAESPEVFYKRGQAILDKVVHRNANVVIVATRSLLVLLGNVLLRRTPGAGGGYREITWPTGGILSFRRQENCFSISPTHSTFNANQYE